MGGVIIMLIIVGVAVIWITAASLLNKYIIKKKPMGQNVGVIDEEGKVKQEQIQNLRQAADQSHNIINNGNMFR